jgi:hypothetical protein
MPEPTSTATATIAATSVAVPVLAVAGVSLGLRADVLLAGFAGAIAAITLLDSVPSTGDTWRELLRTSLRRVGVALGSSVAAGYLAPLLSFFNGIPDYLVLSVAFVAGVGAPRLLPWIIERIKGGPAVPAAPKEGAP